MNPVIKRSPVVFTPQLVGKACQLGCPKIVLACPEIGGHLCRHERQSLLKHNVQAWNGAPGLSLTSIVLYQVPWS